jgi:hypothetical protein
MASIELIGRHVCDPNHPGHYLHKRITIPSAIAIHRIVDDYMVIEIDQDGKKLSELVKRMRGKGNFRFWFKTLKRKFRTDKVTIKMVAEPMGMSEEEAYKIINEISKGAKGFYINIKDDGCLHYWE